MHILTEADLLTVNRDVDDDDQASILSEFLGFISHERGATALRLLRSMPAAWPEVVGKVQAGGSLQLTDAMSTRSPER